MTDTFTLYPDQLRLVDDVRAQMRTSKSVLMQAATGFGKTLVSVSMMQSAAAKGNKSMFVVPRRALLAQTAKDLTKYGIPYGIVASGHTGNPFAKIQLATSGTLVRRLETTPTPNIVFIDETHYGGAELGRVINYYKSKGAWIVGLSATPWKLSGKGLDEWYDTLVAGPQISWLIDNKRLSDFELYQPDTPDFSDAKTDKQIDEKSIENRYIIGSAADHYRKHAMGRINVGFCTSIKHAEITAGIFKDKGIPAAHVSSKMDDVEISRIIRALAKRELLTVTCADLLTFGFDLSSAAGMDVTVESISDLAFTRSLAKQMQKWGRALRMKDYPAMMFDHAGNSGQDAHGMPDSDREWNLAGRAKKKRGESEKTEPTRQCSSCYFVHRPSPTCPHCGFTYPIQSRIVEEVDGDLVKAEKRQAIKDSKKEQGMAKSYGDLVAIGKQKRMKNPYGWASHVIKARQSKG